jgi:DNA-binding NtrC family response regulator
MANVMEYSYILAGGGPIRPEHLPQTLRVKSAAPPRSAGQAATLPLSGSTSAPARTLNEIEMEHVLRVLEKHGGSKTAAAAELGISLKTMYNKLHKLQEMQDERRSAG